MTWTVRWENVAAAELARLDRLDAKQARRIRERLQSLAETGQSDIVKLQCLRTSGACASETGGSSSPSTERPGESSSSGFACETSRHTATERTAHDSRRCPMAALTAAPDPGVVACRAPGLLRDVG
jgi:hypothetical protein